MDALLSEAKTSRGRVSLRTLLRTRLLLGFYQDFSSRAALRVLARIYCLFIILSNTTVLLTSTPNNKYQLMIYIHLFEININKVIGLLTGDKHVQIFFKVIERVDMDMGFDDLLLITPVTQCVFVWLCGINILAISSILLYFYESKRWLFALSLAVFNISRNLTGLIHITTLDLLRHRLSLLHNYFKTNLMRFNNLGGNNTNNQIRKINHCLKLYKTLIDQDVTLGWVKLEIIIGLVFQSTIFIIFGQNTTSSFKSGNLEIISTIKELVQILSIWIVVCLPAVLIELATHEVEKIKFAVGDQLLICSDDSLRAELELALEYLEMRPLKFSIGRVCTIDCSLVLVFAGLCTTYLIFVIQVTGVI